MHYLARAAWLDVRMRFLNALFCLLAVEISAFPALGADDIALTLKDHKFVPAQIQLAADTSAVIVLANEDPTAEEFDSSALKIEKIVVGNDKALIRIRALSPGRYPFMGEYHSATAQGVVIVK